MMKTQQFSPSTERSRLKYLFWGIGICLLLLFFLFFYLYIQIIQDKTSTYEDSKQVAMSETPLNTADTVTRYHGASRYDIVAGEGAEGAKGIAFVPVNNKDKGIIYQTVSKATTKKEMLSSWQSSCNECDLLSIQPAIDKDKPLWEITYLDHQNRYVLDYYRMRNGEFYEQLRFKQ